jgi:predicted RNA-binding Zn ribbon-like protein
MPTFRDPTHDAAEASEALRGLAHATRAFDDPADTYAVIGSLLAGVRSLRQVIDQLATAHLDHRRLAHDDAGDHRAGTRAAGTAADELHRAGTLLNAAEARLDIAFQQTGRIAWYPDPTPERDAFGDPFAPDQVGSAHNQGRPLSM